MPEPEAGLCATCEHSRRIVSGKGSVFRLCRLSATDPRYAKYPRLPVMVCAGYRRVAEAESGRAKGEDG